MPPFKHLHRVLTTIVFTQYGCMWPISHSPETNRSRNVSISFHQSYADGNSTHRFFCLLIFYDNWYCTQISNCFNPTLFKTVSWSILRSWAMHDYKYVNYLRLFLWSYRHFQPQVSLYQRKTVKCTLFGMDQINSKITF